MQALVEFIEFIGGIAETHWPFLTYAVIFAYVGEVSKNYVLTPKRLEAWRQTANRLWNRGGWYKIPGGLVRFIADLPFPFHPAITALALAMFTELPDSLNESAPYGARILYWLGSAILSLGLYDMIHATFKDTGFEGIHLPGEKPEPEKTDEDTEDK